MLSWSMECDLLFVPSYPMLFSSVYITVSFFVSDGSFCCMFTLHANEAAAQCIVIGSVCGCVCLFVGLLPQ